MPGQNVDIVGCTNRGSSLHDLYKMTLPVVLVVFEICQFFEARYQCDADLRPFVAVLGHLFVYCRCLSSTLFAGQILLVVCSNNHLAFFAILPVSIKKTSFSTAFGSGINITILCGPLATLIAPT